MAQSIELFPGFPLPASDYDPLLRELTGTGLSIRVAHSLGSLRALAEESDLPTALLAPSTPGHLVRRALLGAALAAAARAPGSETLARRLREETYRRYGEVPPPGVALSLTEAAARLATARVAPLPVLTRVVVLCSDKDPRHPAQLELARRLGAAVRWVHGGHLFPIAQPRSTAEAIVEAFG